MSTASTASASPLASPAWSARQGMSYGALGMALAFVALPLYVLLPNFYAREFGVSLAALGAILLGARLFDAVIDPALGGWADRLFGRSVQAALRAACAVAVVLAFGFAALFFPPVRGNGLLVWATFCERDTSKLGRAIGRRCAVSRASGGLA
jgi:glycoside/pentoside/hexuronide:cation symporter, GPH family